MIPCSMAVEMKTPYVIVATKADKLNVTQDCATTAVTGRSNGGARHAGGSVFLP